MIKLRCFASGLFFAPHSAKPEAFEKEALRARCIFIDGNLQDGEGLLLQIFSTNVIGPIFFESIELEQMHRGVI
jgi:4-hydroxyphenylpyruvate dioxygenase-like putative hemolysin